MIAPNIEYENLIMRLERAKWDLNKKLDKGFITHDEFIKLGRRLYQKYFRLAVEVLSDDDIKQFAMYLYVEMDGSKSEKQIYRLMKARRQK